MAPRLSVVMAHFEDYQGVFFTVQALRMYHANVMKDVEIVVVDNTPGLEEGQQVQGFLRANASPMTAGVKYIPMPDPISTSSTRNRAIAEATGDHVVCVDCHVLLVPGSLERLLQFYESNPDSLDLYHGPLLMDNLGYVATHFDDVWRAEMWGIWASAWQCDCGKGIRFSTYDDNGETAYRSLEMNPIPLSRCGECGKPLPVIGWAGHEPKLTKAGFTKLGHDPNGQPFDIPGQGLGLFSCRRDAWLGFVDAPGFGGEEMVIHEKFRMAGRRVVCLPFLQWNHRFTKNKKVRYPLLVERKVGKYVLGFNELGMDLEPVYKHFVTERARFTDQEWNDLLSDPVKYVKPKDEIAFNGQPVIKGDDIAEMFVWCVNHERDLNRHMETLRDLAKQCSHATEITKRRESTVALYAGLSNAENGTLVTHSIEPDPIFDRLNRLGKVNFAWDKKSTSEVEKIDETDLLFIDSEHNAECLSRELRTHAGNVRRWIVMHDTKIHCDRGDNGKDGLCKALREFLKNSPDWFVYSHTDEQYGLTVIGHNPDDKPEKQVWIWAPGYGPGTELKEILASLGISPAGNCGCNAKAVDMDKLGNDGCEENLEQIAQWLRDGAPNWGWKDKIKAAANAFATGLAFKLDWTDPYPGLVVEAIRRSREKNNG